MALTPRLDLRQSQHLSLTPQLMQSIKMLQLSHLEIATLVANELEQNPLLDRGEASEIEQVEAKDPSDINGEISDNLIDVITIDSAAKIADNLDTDIDNIFPEQVGQDSVAQSTGSINANNLNGEAPNIEAYVEAKITLADHLWDQAALMFENAADRIIARFLIDSLDDAGYLSADIAAISNQLGADESHVFSVLLQLQACEPLGVFCRNVKECLAIQLAAIDRLDPMMAGLLDNLDLVMKHDLITLGKTINASSEDIADMLKELRSLNPKPGQVFDVLPMQSIVADVFIKKANDGSWNVELNSDVLPKVLVNRTYFAKLKGQVRNEKDKTYLVDCLQSANWLTKSLDQRARTILKVASEIAILQSGFLEHGVSQLVPMTLKMVADAIEMHESTVSRVTSNKYITTPRGLFEMKYFFTTGLSSSSGGDNHSSESVRHFIRQMIENEDIKKILSDEAISKMIKQQHGIDVARRTVMKYRESLNFASSVIRRRQKKSMST